MNREMRRWDELGVVDTIYEEDQEGEGEGEGEDEEDSKSLSLNPSITTSPISPHSSSSLLSPPPSLHARVEEWSEVTGCKTDVVVRLDDQCFNLHKEPLICRSRYLRRRLTESTDITVNPPPGITADTFGQILIFCYDSFINLTPSNLPAVRIAAGWLEMDADEGGGDGSLTWRTEIYFRQEIAGDAGNAGHVLRACVHLLPDVTAALLAARCVEVLASDRGDVGWMEELTALPVAVFRVVAESMRTWFVHDHDLLYQIVDYYLENHREVLTEEEKSGVCRSISCANLSRRHLLHLVQNPRLPLRFIVQAMLLHQLHTRHAYLHLSSSKHHQSPPPAAAADDDNLTLGGILQRDAALRQSSQLRASMQATSFRVESLERGLEGLRRKLRWSEGERAEMAAVRASSFRAARPEERGAGVSGSSCKGNDGEGGKGLGRKLMDGLRSLFKASSPPAKARVVGGGGGGEQRRHRRSNSIA